MTDHGMDVPVLIDSDGKIGHSYGAVCTPHMFVISPKGKVVYQGAPNTGSAMDATPTGDNLVEAAVNAALAGKAPAVTQTKPFDTVKPQPTPWLPIRSCWPARRGRPDTGLRWPRLQCEVHCRLRWLVRARIRSS